MLYWMKEIIRICRTSILLLSRPADISTFSGHVAGCTVSFETYVAEFTASAEATSTSRSVIVDFFNLRIMRCVFRGACMILTRSWWPSGPRRRSAAVACWDCGFEFHQGHGCLSVMNVACFTGTGVCDGPIPPPGASCRGCMCHCGWSDATTIVCTYNE